MKSTRRIAGVLVLAAVVAACGGSDAALTVYSGRTENLVGPLLEDFTAETGIAVEVRYGNSADLALLLEQEGDRSPADVFISQSPGAVGFLAGADLLQPIGDEALELVPPEFRNGAGLWAGMSGRVRVLVYNTDLIDPAELPDSVFDLTQERFRGQIGVAPSNGSFQDFVTGMRETSSDEEASAWLEGLAANDARVYANNTAIVQAVGRGEVPLGLVNHYYNLRALAEDPDAPSENHFFPDGDIGSLVITTALGVLASTDDVTASDRFVQFMLGESAQTFFAEQTFEYPLAAGVDQYPGLPDLAELGVATYDFDQLAGGLERTKELIDASGLEAAAG